MLYLIGKILVYLLISATLGFIIGWYLRQIFMQRKLAEARINDTTNQNYISSLEDENKRLKQQIDKVKKTSKKRQKPRQTKARPVKHNLKKIRGIGAILEKRLNQLGIYSFDQIAAWDKADVAKISKNIGPFSDRVERDNWIIQAKELKDLKKRR